MHDVCRLLPVAAACSDKPNWPWSKQEEEDLLVSTEGGERSFFSFLPALLQIPPSPPTTLLVTEAGGCVHVD